MREKTGAFSRVRIDALLKELACRVEAVQDGLEVDVPPDGPPQHTGIANQHRKRAPTPAFFQLESPPRVATNSRPPPPAIVAQAA